MASNRADVTMPRQQILPPSSTDNSLYISTDSIRKSDMSSYDLRNISYNEQKDMAEECRNIELISEKKSLQAENLQLILATAKAELNLAQAPLEALYTMME